MDATSLQIAADTQENITLTWQENNQTKSYCVSNDRTQIAPCDARPTPSNPPRQP